MSSAADLPNPRALGGGLEIPELTSLDPEARRRIEVRETAEHLVREFLHGETRRLCVTNRYSGQFICRNESVAEHSFYVAFYAAFIYHRLLELFLEDAKSIDLGILLLRATFHDLDEMKSGDFLRKFKYSDEVMRKEISRVVRTQIISWADSHKLPDQIVEAVLEAKTPDLYGEILILSDFISVCAFIYENVKMGNQLLLPEAKNVSEEMQKMVDEGRIRHSFLTKLAAEHIRAMAALGYDRL